MKTKRVIWRTYWVIAFIIYKVSGYRWIWYHDHWYDPNRDYERREREYLRWCSKNK